MSIVDHGVPVFTSRQYALALAPDPTGTKWNYIAAYNGGGATWTAVVKDITGSPTCTQYQQTLAKAYPNLHDNKVATQLRAQNGRIFIRHTLNYTNWYEPTDEKIYQLPAVVETPAIDQNASLQSYSAQFDTTGILYFGTMESHYRRGCVIQTDPRGMGADPLLDPPTQKVIGYVGDAVPPAKSSNAYTTYVKFIAVDTITAQKYVYCAYGEDPWQLWALNVTTGVATKLYEVTSAGNIAFQNITGKGWIATIDTALNQPTNVRTQWWCLDGALYAYAGTGTNPPAGAPAVRNVTPASNPLVGAPTLDTAGGTGIVGYRFVTTDPYTYVRYPINDAAPVEIELLVPYTGGIAGVASTYLGFFKNDGAGTTWWGAYTGGPSLALGGAVNVGGTFYMAGYPDGNVYTWDPTLAWNPTATTGKNPAVLPKGFGYQGTQYAGIKYAHRPLAHVSTAGTGGRIYVAGHRERNGIGMGVGYYDLATATFAGTFDQSPVLPLPSLSTVSPDGLCHLPASQRIVVSTHTISGIGTAPLYVFDYNLNCLATLPVMSGVSALGRIFETSTPGVITGIIQGSGSTLGLWQYDVTTQSLLRYVEWPIVGTLDKNAICKHSSGSVWIALGSSLVRINIDALSVTIVQDLSSIIPVTQIEFGGDNTTLFMAATIPGPDSTVGSKLHSLDVTSYLTSGTGGGGEDPPPDPDSENPPPVVEPIPFVPPSILPVALRDSVWRWRRRLHRQKCSVVSVAIDDNYTDGPGFTLTALALEIGKKRGLDRIPWRGGTSTTPSGTNTNGNGK